MSSSSHAIWQVGLFKKLNKDQTECTVCQKVLSSKNHTVNGLVKHLAIHKDARSKYLDLQKSRSDGNGSLDNFVVRPSANLTATDKAIVHLVAVANISFSVVNHPVFRMLFRLFNKTDLLKDESYYRVTLLPRVYNLVRTRVLAHLGSCEALSFTIDIWTGVTPQSFISLTAQGITKDWVRVKFLLCCREFPGSHTGERVAELVSEMLAEWKIDRSKCHSFVHDDGKNMNKAFRQFTDLEDALCGAHMLHLVVRNGLFPMKDNKYVSTPVNDSFVRGRSLITHFRHSPLAVGLLEKLQLEQEVPEHALIQDVVTRWDSSRAMSDRLLEQKPALDAYCTNHRRDLLLSHAEWSIIEDVSNLLEPFAELSKFMCRDESPISVQVAVLLTSFYV